jgi:hypothetical protein
MFAVKLRTGVFSRELLYNPTPLYSRLPILDLAKKRMPFCILPTYAFLKIHTEAALCLAAENFFKLSITVDLKILGGETPNNVSLLCFDFHRKNGKIKTKVFPPFSALVSFRSSSW